MFIGVNVAELIFLHCSFEFFEKGFFWKNLKHFFEAKQNKMVQNQIITEDLYQAYFVSVVAGSPQNLTGELNWNNMLTDRLRFILLKYTYVKTWYEHGLKK